MSKVHSKEPISIKLVVSETLASSVIGTGGANVKELMIRTKANISVSQLHDYFPNTSFRTIILSGTLSAVSFAHSLVCIRAARLARNETPDDDTQLTLEMLQLVPEAVMTQLISIKVSIPELAQTLVCGQNGNVMKSIAAQSGGTINISEESTAHEKLIHIDGSTAACIVAINLILEQLIADPRMSRYMNYTPSYKLYVGMPMLGGVGMNAPYAYGMPYQQQQQHHQGGYNQQNNAMYYKQVQQQPAQHMINQQHNRYPQQVSQQQLQSAMYNAQPAYPNAQQQQSQHTNASYQQQVMNSYQQQQMVQRQNRNINSNNAAQLPQYKSQQQQPYGYPSKNNSNMYLKQQSSSMPGNQQSQQQLSSNVDDGGSATNASADHYTSIFSVIPSDISDVVTLVSVNLSLSVVMPNELYISITTVANTTDKSSANVDEQAKQHSEQQESLLEYIQRCSGALVFVVPGDEADTSTAENKQFVFTFSGTINAIKLAQDLLWTYIKESCSQSSNNANVAAVTNAFQEQQI